MIVTPEKKSNGRLIIVYLILLAFGLACFTRMIVLGVKYRSLFLGTSEKCLDKTKPEWEANPLASDTNCNCFLIETVQEARRGDIYDDKGRTLASTIVAYDITIDGKQFYALYKNSHYVKNPAVLDSLIDSISTGFYTLFKNRYNYSYGDYKKKVFSALKEHKNVQIVRSAESNEKQWIIDRDIDSLKTLPLLGVQGKNILNLTINRFRIHPYGDLAKRTLGRELGENRYVGIENAKNQYLSGTPGFKKKVIVSKIEIPLTEKGVPRDGANVHTTLNLEMQNIVHNELLSVLKEYNAEWGCAVVMETKTGAVKASSNLTRQGDGITYKDDYNYLQNYLLEPGSTFKLASLLAFLDRTSDDSAKMYPILAHDFTLTSKSGKKAVFSKYDEAGRLAGERAYPINAFQRSSNVGIASMIFDKFNGYSDYLSKIDSMYITTRFNTDIGEVKAPEINRNAKDFHSYYNICFGTGFKMTPMQSLLYFNAVANDGRMIVPYFMSSVTKGNDTLERNAPEILTEQMCKPETIKKAKEYLLSVVEGENGTARRFKNKNFTFAGKTGTRDIWDLALGGYDKSKNCVSFCGYFPAEDPKYTCIVYIYNVPKKSSIAVGTFVNIAQNILNSSNYDALQTIDKSKGKKSPFKTIIPTSQLAILSQELGFTFDFSKVSSSYVLPKGNEISLHLENYLVPINKDIPNVVGLPVASAVYELSKAGYEVKIEGKGVVKRQSPPGQKNIITLSLGP